MSARTLVVYSLYVRLRTLLACVRCRPGRYKYIIKEESANVYYIALELASPEAIDAATYKLNARNQHGESNANLKLNFDGNYCY